tara:strand:- start:9699 stop:10121 length:423 start_codon:yes stop_codon:yes gene_type:complete
MSINPEDIKNNPEQIKQMIALLSSMLEDSDTEPKTKRRSTKKKTTKKKTTKKKTTTTRKPKQAKSLAVNKFDQMSESGMFKENPEIAKKLYSKPPMKRRPKKELIAVKCRICGKQEEVSSSLISSGKERYKCNKCSSSAG